MSTNPFDDDDDAPLTRPPPGGVVGPTVPASRRPPGGGGGTATLGARSGSYRKASSQQPTPPPPPSGGQSTSEEPIWAARNVEWPIPPSIPSATYAKLNRMSRQAGAAFGITEASSAGGGFGSFGAASAVGGGGGAADDGDGEGGGGGEGSGYYAGGIAGLMSRVLNTTGGGGSSAADARTEEDDLASSGAASRACPLRPPRNRCVAASNGWIVAAIECVPSASSMPSSSSHAPPLRLVSRWNVRRGTTSAPFESLVPLPPAVRASGTNDVYSGSARIAHVFVDPTGCHAFFSAWNGEAYHLHSSTRRARKLRGFGPNGDGSSGCSSGFSASSAEGNATIQVGLTPGSHVTAVGWDKERGTEGSTKTILLGTSAGEIYEYALVSPNIEGGDEPNESSQNEADAMPVLLHRLNSAEGGGGGGGGEGGSVGGLHFERLSRSSPSIGGAAPAGSAAGGTLPDPGAGNGMIVLASTGGQGKRTRFHTFWSPSASGLRAVFAQMDENHSSFVELPGSIDFPDLRLCNDHIALRTETGIYYGTIDRSAAGGSGGSGLGGPGSGLGGSGGITESGILPYDHQSSAGFGETLPVSIALTPHHFITLSDTNEVRFVNRVAKKVIQKERVDWVMMSQSSSGGIGPTSSLDESVVMGLGELMMDVRRPDQVWLRKSRALVHISSSCEDRDVWKFTLQRCLDLPVPGTSSSSRVGGPGSSARANLFSPVSGSPTIPSLTGEEKLLDAKFEHAKSLCANTAQKAVVTVARAEYHLSQGRVELAAKYMAQCPRTLAPFADTSIRLALPMLGIDDPKSYGHSQKAKDRLSASNLALVTYLSDKMRVGRMKGDDVACTMIGAWLAELHLHERERAVGGSTGSAVRSSGGSLTGASASNNALLHQFLSANVHSMDAKTIVKILGSHDVGAAECSGYAAASGDIGTAVNAALCSAADDKSGALDALRVLNDSPLEQSEPFYYKHACTLLSRAPMAASKSFLARFPQGLSPTRLLPAFMHYERKRAEMKSNASLSKNEVGASGPVGLGTTGSVAGSTGGRTGHGKSSPGRATHLENLHIEGPRSFIDDDGVEVRIDQGPHTLPHCGSFVDDENASIKYLEGVIKLGCASTAIFNYLISLYASMDDEAPLFRFLSAHVPAAAASAPKATGIAEAMLNQGEDPSSSPLDMSYALRVILRTGRHFRSAVKLYMGFGMRQQAVELALKVDPALARELARDSVGAEERKRLWLMIARNAAADGENREGKDVVAKVVSVLKDCGPDVLSIEDVLPFLPDFAQIDQFKDEICGALTSYSSKIDQYLQEMNECDQTCDALRDEISRLGTHGMQMKADARCAFTKKSVLNEAEPFYLFPSGFVALESALKKEVMPHLNEKQRSRVGEIEQELTKLKGGKNMSRTVAGTDADQTIRIEELQSELDGLIAAECPLTGTIMVDSIDHGFIESMEEDEAFVTAGQWFDKPVVEPSISASPKKAAEPAIHASFAPPAYNF